jgi:hypothetical protein
MAKLNDILATSFTDEKKFEVGKLYTLNIDALEYIAVDHTYDEEIVSAIVKYINDTWTLHRIVFTSDFMGLQILSGIHWIVAAKRLGLKKIRGWYTDQGFLYGDDFIMEIEPLLKLDP